MNISRRVASLTLVWIITHSTLAGGGTLAQSVPSTESAEPETCFVSKERTIMLPASLSLAQKGYLSELCDKVMRFQNRLLVTSPMDLPTKNGAIEFENAKLLYELDHQHVANMSTLIEKALAVQPFPEDAFWIAWLNERRTYRNATSPLIHHQAELILKKQQQEE